MPQTEYCYHCGVHHPLEDMRQILTKGNKRWRCIKSIEAAKQGRAVREAFGRQTIASNEADARTNKSRMAYPQRNAHAWTLQRTVQTDARFAHPLQPRLIERICDSVATMHLDNPSTFAVRSLASVAIIAAASSPAWADITVTVLGMANGGARPVLVDKNICVAVGPERKDRKILQLTTDAKGKVTITDPDAAQPLAFYCPPLHPSQKPRVYVDGARVKAYCLTAVLKK